MLSRIRYVSRLARALDPGELEKIVALSQVKNARLGISGFLVLSDDMFFQDIEGPREAIASLYEVIRRDPRHKQVVLLKREDDVPKAVYPDWAMKLLPPGDAMSQVIREVSDARQKLDSSLNGLEQLVWRAQSSSRR